MPTILYPNRDAVKAQSLSYSRHYMHMLETANAAVQKKGYKPTKFITIDTIL